MLSDRSVIWYGNKIYPLNLFFAPWSYDLCNFIASLFLVVFVSDCWLYRFPFWVIIQLELPFRQMTQKMLGLQLDPKPSPLTDDRCTRSPEAVPRSSALSLSSEFLLRHGTDRRGAASGLRACCGDPKLSRLDDGRDFKTVLVLI